MKRETIKLTVSLTIALLLVVTCFPLFRNSSENVLLTRLDESSKGRNVSNESADHVHEEPPVSTTESLQPTTSIVRPLGRENDGEVSFPHLAPYVSKDSTGVFIPTTELRRRLKRRVNLQQILASTSYLNTEPRCLLEQSLMAKKFDFSGRMKYLGTEKFYPKYGLTNLMMTIAAMLAYGAETNRVVVFPTKTPVPIEELLDLEQTQNLLLEANVVIYPPSEGSTKELSDHFAANSVKPSKARSRGENLGYRSKLSSEVFSDAYFGYYRLKESAQRMTNVTFLIQRDFFLRFPFRVQAPLDLCYFIRRMVFHKTIQSKAEALEKSLHSLLVPTETGSRPKLLALHVRLEWDVKLLFKEAGAISADELERWMIETIFPLARKAKVDGIYICSGSLRHEYVSVFHKLSTHSLPILNKVNTTVDLFSLEKVTLPPEKTKRNHWTTSHSMAAIDVSILRSAYVSVVFAGSTLPLAVLSRRCPESSRRRLGLRTQLGAKVGNSTLLTEKSAPKKKDKCAPSEDDITEDMIASMGVFGYQFDLSARRPRLGPIRFLSCSAPYMSQCYNDPEI